MGQTSEVKAIPASEAPISVVMISRSVPNDISEQWKEIRDDDMRAEFGMRTIVSGIEPMPTLAHRNNV